MVVIVIINLIKASYDKRWFNIHLKDFKKCQKRFIYFFTVNIIFHFIDKYWPRKCECDYQFPKRFSPKHPWTNELSVLCIALDRVRPAHNILVMEIVLQACNINFLFPIVLKLKISNIQFYNSINDRCVIYFLFLL